MLPDFTNNWDMAVAVFIMPIAVQWWAVWYPGAEPGGGSYIAQRMLASKSEKDALGAVLFFNVAHYVLRPWPWILVALCSILVYPELSDIQRAFPNLDPRLLGHDIAYPAMLKFLPAGFVGLMVGGLDRRELVDDPHAPQLGRVVPGARLLPPLHPPRRRAKRTTSWPAGSSTIGLFICSSLLVYLLDTAKDAFDIILQVGAGTGLLYLVRWFWWRVNAWCEVVAMISSFAVSVLLLVLAKNGVAISTHVALLITIARDDGLLGRDRVARTGDRSRGAGGVLPQGPAVGRGLGADPQGRGACRRRARAPTTSRWRSRLDRRLHGDLVGALHRRQLALHAAGGRRRPVRGLRRQHARPGERHADALGAGD